MTKPAKTALKSPSAVTPMMQQYLEIKRKNPEYLLMFRLGDFYELFFEDAHLASKELELTLTGRDCGQEERAPMCGVPYHSVDAYIQRLVQKGYKVAICEQLEDPATAKGIVKRDIVRVITPGTITDEAMLDSTKNNFLTALYLQGSELALSTTDVSTGEIYATLLTGEDAAVRAKSELAKYAPSELLLLEDGAALSSLEAFTGGVLGALITKLDGVPEHLSAAARLRFGPDCLIRQGAPENETLWVSIGLLLRYLTETQRSSHVHLGELFYRPPSSFLGLDAATRRNLELTSTIRGDRSRRGSLLDVLDRTKSAMGGRLLRSWLEQPLRDVSSIEERLDAVEALVQDSGLRRELQEKLRSFYDLQRLMTRMFYLTGNARDLRSIGETLSLAPDLKTLLTTGGNRALALLSQELLPLPELTDLLLSAITDTDIPVSVREGGLIANGYSPEIDRIRDLVKNSKRLLAEIETRERAATGIKNLKISYNKVFGYYIEITRSNYDLVPSHYIRKQTLVNSERFITQELKELEAELLTANERLCALEYEAFCELRQKVTEHASEILKTAAALAKLDVFCSLAQVALDNHYCRPDVNEGSTILIKEGRHPVVEQMSDRRFVSNDTLLDCGDNRFSIITGPNMAGKSTYMRQVAIIVLMAQMGSFVPADQAVIGLVDQIFTRVGASDDLSAGQSTFLVEMSETAGILKNATRQSLIIFDEIGRGTSTFDGMSIARAVIEYVADDRILGAKTLFATHYHELTELESTLRGVRNYSVAVKKQGDDIIFLRRIVRGGTDDSYGIEVAKLAGVPQPVIDKARAVLERLEQGSPAAPAPAIALPAAPVVSPPSAGEQVLAALEQIDVSTLTPIEAINRLYDLKKLAEVSVEDLGLLSDPSENR